MVIGEQRFIPATQSFKDLKFVPHSWLKVSVNFGHHQVKNKDVKFAQIEMEQARVTQAYTALAESGSAQGSAHSDGHQKLTKARRSGPADAAEPDPPQPKTPRLSNHPPATARESASPPAVTSWQTPKTVRKGASGRILDLEDGGQLDLDRLPEHDEDCTCAMMQACKRRIDELEEELTTHRKRRRQDVQATPPSHAAATSKERAPAKLNVAPHRKKIVNALRREIKALKFRAGEESMSFWMGCASMDGDDEQSKRVKFTEVMSEEEVRAAPLTFALFGDKAMDALPLTDAGRLHPGRGDPRAADAAEQARLHSHHQDF